MVTELGSWDGLRGICMTVHRILIGIIICKGTPGTRFDRRQHNLQQPIDHREEQRECTWM